ncbi:hypothetical protein B0A48_08445 [Cryoendolithus antarcticus]|uniref:Zinc finger PHD-type domain-containing protein n=1 Tax=Cryoendolithus antarcticus TaxID=1507870 RepID=A0A1V8T5Z2_9PEZI|nr:hypothetical protein B0A48_08445 [Cryoendolithus antarcticus]
MDSDYPAAALQMASESEGTGLVLNERYTFEEYIYRRGNFLGRQPEYAHLQNACFIARRHAAEVYPNEEAILRVQDVRAREIATQQDPLLPLPTTSNTGTIDGFATCLPTEAAGQFDNGSLPELGLQPRITRASTRKSAQEVGGAQASIPPVSGRPPRFCEADPGDNVNEIEVAPSTQDESASAASPTTVATSAHAVGASSTLASSSGPLGAPSKVQQVQESQMQREVPVGAKAVESSVRRRRDQRLDVMNDATDTVVQHTGISEPTAQPQALSTTDVSSITPIAQPGKGTLRSVTKQPSREQKLIAAPGVSAMAGYGMKVPVKTRGKRDHDEDEADTESVTTLAGDDDEKDHAIPEPPKKKAKVAAIAKRPPSKTEILPKGVARPVKKVAANTKANIGTLHASAPPKPKPTASKAATPKISTPKAATATNLNAVINGIALPKTKEAAIAASMQRREALVRTRTPAGPTSTMSRSGRHQKPTPKDPSARDPVQANLMPEFFPSCTEDGNDVHCICGVETDDNKHMVQCEKCFVWQHNACLLPELTKKELAKVNFLCQVCDPWERRVVLRDLRKREGKVD